MLHRVLIAGYYYVLDVRSKWIKRRPDAFMNELRDERLNQETGGIVSRDKEIGRVTVVAYDYPPEMKVSLQVTNTLAAADAIDANGSVRELALDLDHVPAGLSFKVEVLARQHGDPGDGLGSDGTAGAADAEADGRASEAGFE